ncbi:MAG: YihY family inner membrane protein [Betaproteobacteria bacterium]|nr:YihY family inner membrane protein [Betaproteobacteria bacterium]
MRRLLQILRDHLGFLAFVFRRWGEDRCPQVAGSLTYTTLLSLVPLFTIVVALLSSLPFFEDVMVQVKIFLLINLVPDIAGKIITVYMQQFSGNAGRLGTIALVGLFAMALALLFTIDKALNAIWRVRNRRKFWQSALGYSALLAAGPVLMGASLAATSWLVAVSLDQVNVSRSVEQAILRVVPVSVSATAFFLVYRFFPNRAVPWRHAAIGGILAAVAFEVMKTVFAEYVRLVPTYSLVYGAFAAIPIFLLWVYLSWLVVLFGAEFTASLAYWSGGNWRRQADLEANLRAALETGRALVLAGGGPLTHDELVKAANLPAAVVDESLARLEREGVVVQSPAGWALALPAAREAKR